MRVRILLVVAAVAFGLALFVTTAGGIAWAVGPFTLSIRTAGRPLLVGLVATIVMLAHALRAPRGPAKAGPHEGAASSHEGAASSARGPRDDGNASDTVETGRYGANTSFPVASGFSRTSRGVDLLSQTGFGALFICTLAILLRYTVTTCGGLDSYGYVSTAHLFLSGHVTQPEPVAALLPFDHAIRAVTPLGYVPAPSGDAIVPRFPPGLPLVMALFVALFGKAGAFYVAPTLAIGTTLLVYFLARGISLSRNSVSDELPVRPSSVVRRPSSDSSSRLSAPASRLLPLLASSLVFTNPVLLNSAIQPMSDVPAAFWVMAAVAALWRDRPWAFVGGVSAGMAMLTRPPLLLAAIAIGGVAAWKGRGPLSKYAAGLAPAIIGLLVLHWRLYGHPLNSGYGSAGALFGASVIAENLTIQAKWLTIVLTPLLPLGFLVACLWGHRRFAWFAGVLFVSVALPYTLYRAVFVDWEILRFLLPGLVPLGIVCADGFLAALSRAGFKTVGPNGTRVTQWMPVAALAIAVFAAIGSHSYLSNHNVFGLWRQESKYPLVGDWFQQHTSGDTIVLAALHSGSLRYYGGHSTLRWTEIPPDKLANTVDVLERRGYRCYLVLDGAEEEQEFRQRFPADELAAVDMSNEARVRNVSILKLQRR